MTFLNVIKNNILITGGNGFIGKNIVNDFGSEYNIYNLSHNKMNVNEKCINIPWDMNDPNSFEEVKKELKKQKFEACIHAASIVGNTDKTETEYYNVNVDATHKIARYCADNDIKKMLYLSTGSVYKQTDSIITEESVRDPNGVYGITKYMGEFAVRSVCLSSSLNAWSLRLFYPYGVGLTKNRYISTVLDRVKTKQPIDVDFASPFLFNPIYIHDLLYILRIFLNVDYVSRGYVINIAGEESINVLQMSKIFGEVLGVEPTFKPTEYVHPLVADISKVKAILFNKKRILSKDYLFTPIINGLTEYANANK